MIVLIFIGRYMKKFITAAVLAASGFVVAGQVNAAASPATANFNVKIQVLSTCAITASDVVFEDVYSGTAPSSKTGTLNVTCTNQTPYDIGLTYAGEMVHATDATATIAYELYKTASDTAKWNDSDNLYSSTGSGLVQNIPLVAKVTGSTNVRAGNYADTVTATVTY